MTPDTDVADDEWDDPPMPSENADSGGDSPPMSLAFTGAFLFVMAVVSAYLGDSAFAVTYAALLTALVVVGLTLRTWAVVEVYG